jgi:hypothetical protein
MARRRRVGKKGRGRTKIHPAHELGKKMKKGRRKRG